MKTDKCVPQQKYRPENVRFAKPLNFSLVVAAKAVNVAVLLLLLRLCTSMPPESRICHGLLFLYLNRRPKRPHHEQPHFGVAEGGSLYSYLYGFSSITKIVLAI